MTPDAIREAVLAAYTTVGRNGSRAPEGTNIATGAALACQLGYPSDALERAPEEILDAFVGAAALGAELPAQPGEWVADLGCGAGLDAFVLARRGFRVAAVDGCATLLERFASAIRETDTERPGPIRALLPSIPLRDGCVDWAIMNGVANLLPNRHGLLCEVRRILRSGGGLMAADLLAIDEIPASLRNLPEAWTWCVAGATRPEDWAQSLRRAGFREIHVEVRERIPPLARGVVRASKPADAR